MRKGRMGSVPEVALGLGLSAGPPCQAPQIKLFIPRGRGPKPGSCVPSFLGTEKLVLAAATGSFFGL